MNSKDLFYMALFSLLTIILGLFPPIMVPSIGVPVTAQSMGCMLAGSILGAKRGLISLLIFILLIIIGLPVLAGGKGGLDVFFTPSGGFILAWPLAAGLIGYLYEKNLSSLSFIKEAFFILLGGIILVYTIGIPWVAFFAELSLYKAALGTMNFLPGAIIKVILTIFITRIIRRYYPNKGDTL
ncbi:biotin transporter BioY [Xenorhabdus sp. DI]|uniref:biotin transporter BioY n=1 Tax=Xenorhabdus doucetiae TaxID=351671 RepID=UPI00198F1BEC|nr:MULTISPECIES: biotin transporter BioY [unclassified Xenorhabdus]MBD2786476.1 biotin transporter BioY [Xenorhabdus sp. 3]MBD2790095.1 biotin transporter BioY [Xenorhabdus sp. DI]